MENQQLTVRRNTLAAPKCIEDVIRVSEYLSKTSLVPRDIRGNVGEVMSVIMLGLELGFGVTQSILNIAIINGKPTVYGDGLLAVCQRSPDYEWMKEEQVGDDSEMMAVCIVKRKGSEPHEVSFSQGDASRAGLWGKRGPWSQYPKRMLQMRARGFALRDQFSDALCGLLSREEVEDYDTGRGLGSVTAEIVEEEKKPPMSREEMSEKSAEFFDGISACDSPDALNAVGVLIREELGLFTKMEILSLRHHAKMKSKELSRATIN